jgi:streptomycin 6-kinase
MPCGAAELTRSLHVQPLPQYELYVDLPQARAPPGVLEFPWAWRRTLAERAPAGQQLVSPRAATPTLACPVVAKADGDEEGFCGVDALLAAAEAAGGLPPGSAGVASAREVIPLTAGFCNRVHRVRLLQPGAAGGALDLVVKEFSALSRARSTAAAFATDRLCPGSPELIYASGRGVLHRFVEGGAVLTEASMGDGADLATVRAVAAAVAGLHCTPRGRLPLPVGVVPKPMVWVSVDSMMNRLARHSSAGRLPAAPAPRSWTVAEVARACAGERAILDATGGAIKVGHGDLKPSNVLAVGGGAVLIDFELAGPNYRGFDLCKLFRNDKGGLAEGPLHTFLAAYRETSNALGADPALPSAAALAAGASTTRAPSPAPTHQAAWVGAEAERLEPVTWLEAAVFFMTVLCERGFAPAQYEVAERLSAHRWARYLAMRPQFARGTVE